MRQHALERTAARHAVCALLLAWAASTVVVALTLALAWGPFGVLVWFEGWVVIPVSMAVTAAAIGALPMRRLGGAIDADLRGHHADGRLRNLAEEVSIAVGADTRSVMVHPSPIANVGALSTPDGIVVMVTAGALHQLRRDELEALIASQFAGMNDRWCLLATRAEVAWTLTKVLAFGGFVLAAPVGVFVGVAMTVSPRTIEATRDLCADVAAVRATRHPEALARAMRRLAPAAVHSHAQQLGIRRHLPVNPFLAVPKRHQTTQTISTDEKIVRSWTEVDEVASEMILRADRAEAMAAGGDPRGFTGREFRRRWTRLGSS